MYYMVISEKIEQGRERGRITGLGEIGVENTSFRKDLTEETVKQRHEKG